MGVESIHNTIRAAVDAEFNGEYPIAYDNAPAPTPTDPPTPWMRAAVRTNGTQQTAIGPQGNVGHRYRTSGTLLISLFDASEAGDGVLLQLADRVVSVFRSVRVSGVVFRTPTVTTVGRFGGSWQINVSCPFYADDVGA